MTKIEKIKTSNELVREWLEGGDDLEEMKATIEITDAITTLLFHAEHYIRLTKQYELQKARSAMNFCILEQHKEGRNCLNCPACDIAEYDDVSGTCSAKLWWAHTLFDVTA